MQITPNIPDVGLGAAPRKDPAPTAAVTPVPGVTDPSRSPDARAAVLAAVPVNHALDSERGREATSARRAKITEELTSTLLRQGATAAPDRSVISASTAPNLLPLITAWLKENVTARGAPARWPAPPALFSSPVSLAPDARSAPLGDASAASANSDTSEPARAVTQFMGSLYAALAASPFFAAQRLSRTLGQITAFPPPAAPDVPDVPDAPDASGSPSTANTRTPGASSVDSATNSADPFVDLLARIRALGLLQDTGGEAVARNLSEVATDAPAAPQAARLIMEGQLVWQGEIAPGVPLRIERRDAWRSHPERPGEMQRGVALDLEVELPSLGPIRIEGMQWGAEISIAVRGAAVAASTSMAWLELKGALQRQFPGLRLEALRAEGGAP